jgi:hypothetical protein
VTGFRIDTEVVVRYAAKAEASAARLDAAAESVSHCEMSHEMVGDLGGQTGVGEAYARAAEVLRRHLAEGSVALLSASGALREVTGHHADRDSEHADLITKAGEL